jgi:hypothetical protein
MVRFITLEDIASLAVARPGQLSALTAVRTSLRIVDRLHHCCLNARVPRRPGPSVQHTARVTPAHQQLLLLLWLTKPTWHSMFTLEVPSCLTVVGNPAVHMSGTCCR